MIVGGLLILAGLWFSSSKTDNYTAWCKKKINQFDTQISKLNNSDLESEVVEV